jgi:RNA polymerase sigma-70 factor, ECF subfamily
MRDAAWFEVLVDESAGILRAYLAGMGVETGQIDDLVQESFMALWRQRETLPASLVPLAWLKTVAKRRAIDHLRATSVRRRHLAEVVATEAEAPAPSGSADPSVLDALSRCLEGLPASARELLQRRYRDDDSAEAIATGAGSDVSTVRRRLAELRAALLRCVERRLGTIPS